VNGVKDDGRGSGASARWAPFVGSLGVLLCTVLAACGSEADPSPEPTPPEAPPTKPKDLRWEIISLDRTLDGDLWATSSTRLHRSADNGRTWESVADLDAYYTIGLAFPDSSGVYLQSWRDRAVWDAETGVTTPIENLGSTGLGDEFRRGNVWLACGWYDTGPAAERIYGSTGPSLAIPGVIGCTACSVDGGRTWTLVDSYDGGAVMAMHLTDDNLLTLLLDDFGVRRGRLVLDEPGGPRAELETVAKPRRLAPPGSRLWWWVFVDGARGWIGANDHHGGAGRLFETFDRGVTWQLASKEEQPVTEIYRLGDGRWIKLEKPWVESARLFVWEGDRFVEFPSPPEMVVMRVERALVDSTGDLLLLLQTGELWVYRTEVDTWRCLWIEPSGGARLRR